MGRIHASALVDPRAELADDVVVGAFAIVEGAVRLGAGCVVRPYAHLIGPLDAGPGNEFGIGCVIGERPQHLAYRGETTELRIGAHNTLREHVTIHRAMPGGRTVLGNHNLLMVNAHIAHDSVVGDHCILVNGSVIGGHCRLGDRVLLSGNAAVHQNCTLGRLAMLSAVSATTMDVPPFLIQQSINQMGGVNVVGMRRAGFTSAQIGAVREAYRILFLRGLLRGEALEQLERELGDVDVVREMIAFIRQSKRGVTKALRARHTDRAEG